MKVSDSHFKKLAMQRLKMKDVQALKKLTCAQFTDKKQKNECMASFEKGFVDSFVKAARKAARGK